MNNSTRTMSSSRVKIALTVLFHSTCAISVTLISKSALNGLSLPVSLLFFQTGTQFLLLTAIGFPLGLLRAPPIQIWKDLTLLAAARQVGILAKTFCLAAVDASFYQIARGLLLPFSLILSYIFLKKDQMPALSLMGCALVMAGFGAGVITDSAKGGVAHTSPWGIFMGIGSSFTTAVESIVVKKYTSSSDLGMWQLIWMTSGMQLIPYVPLLSLSGEVSKLLAASVADYFSFMKTAVTTGFASLLLSLATFLQISVTSPTTHMIVTAARGVAQSALAVLIFSEKVSTGRILGIIFILAGSGLYAWGKDRLLNTRQPVVYGKVEKDEKYLELEEGYSKKEDLR